MARAQASRPNLAVDGTERNEYLWALPQSRPRAEPITRWRVVCKSLPDTVGGASSWRDGRAGGKQVARTLPVGHEPLLGTHAGGQGPGLREEAMSLPVRGFSEVTFLQSPAFAKPSWFCHLSVQPEGGKGSSGLRAAGVVEGLVNLMRKGN